MNEKEKVSLKILRYGSTFLAILAFLIGLLTLIKGLNIFTDHHERAVIWFGLAVVAILIPYIKEITIKDLKVVIQDLKEAKQSLDGARISATQLQDKLTETRNELIYGYQQFLEKICSADECKERIKRMSQLYLNEMGMEVKTIKGWLKNLNYPVKDDSNEITDEYIEAIKKFQDKHQLGQDGIFGYRTLNKMYPIIHQSDTV